MTFENVNKFLSRGFFLLLFFFFLRAFKVKTKREGNAICVTLSQGQRAGYQKVGHSIELCIERGK